jgi:hypothetical protein
MWESIFLFYFNWKIKLGSLIDAGAEVSILLKVKPKLTHKSAYFQSVNGQFFTHKGLYQTQMQNCPI